MCINPKEAFLKIFLLPVLTSAISKRVYYYFFIYLFFFEYC